MVHLLVALSKKHLRVLIFFLLVKLAKYVVWLNITIFLVVNSFNTEELPEPYVLKYYHWTSFVHISQVKGMETAVSCFKGVVPLLQVQWASGEMHHLVHTNETNFFEAIELLSVKSKVQHPGGKFQEVE